MYGYISLLSYYYYVPWHLAVISYNVQCSYQDNAQLEILIVIELVQI